MRSWVGVKEAANLADVHPNTVKRWCRHGDVRARRLARGLGPWRIYVDADGLPADGPPNNRSNHRAKSRRLRPRQH